MYVSLECLLYATSPCRWGHMVSFKRAKLIDQCFLQKLEGRVWFSEEKN
jgi:hypothetical protein